MWLGCTKRPKYVQYFISFSAARDVQNGNANGGLAHAALAVAVRPPLSVGELSDSTRSGRQGTSAGGGARAGTDGVRLTRDFAFFGAQKLLWLGVLTVPHRPPRQSSGRPGCPSAGDHPPEGAPY